MCLRDLMARLVQENVSLTRSQVRWAINSGKISRPPLDGSLRFDFRDDHIEELRAYFQAMQSKCPTDRRNTE